MTSIMKNRIECFEKENFNYLVKRGKYKRLTIKIDEGLITVNVPMRMNLETLEPYFISKIDIIKKYLNRQNKVYKPSYEIGSIYHILGEEYIIKQMNNIKTTIDVNNHYLYVKNIESEKIKKELDKFVLKLAIDIFEKRIYEISQIMMKDIGFTPSFIIKRSVRNWGYCKMSKKLIMLNISLIHVKMSLIDYVIYHEMSHFKYANHSKDFHNFLRKYLPNENNLRKELKNYSITY